MNMKKILCIVLAISMLFAMALTATAALGSSDLGAGTQGGTEKPVNVIVNGVETASTVYYVVISWGSMDFTYDFDEAGRVWDPETHKDVVTEGNKAWEVDTENGQVAIGAEGVKSEVTVTNHSNAKVKYTASLQAGADLDGVSVALTGTSTDTLESGMHAEHNSFLTADKGTFAVEVTGAPTQKIEANTTLKTLSILLESGV